MIFLPSSFLARSVLFALIVIPDLFAANSPVTPNGAWCWFADPRAVHVVGAHDRTYMSWVTDDPDGLRIMVAQYDHTTSTLFKRSLKLFPTVDDHDNPALLVLPDKRLMIFYSKHSDVSDANMYYRVTLNPEDVTAWGSETLIPSNGAGTSGVCYAYPVILSKEVTAGKPRIYLFMRSLGAKTTLVTSDNLGATWSLPTKQIMTCPSPFLKPYLKLETNGYDEIHFAWADGNAGDYKGQTAPPYTLTSIYYLKYKSNAAGTPGGGSFFKANGTTVATLSSVLSGGIMNIQSVADSVYLASVSGGRAWIWDVAINGSGNPVLTYSRLPVVSPTDPTHEYRYAYWDGVAWQDRSVATNAGGTICSTVAGAADQPYYSGGIVLDHSNTSRVYLSRDISGVFEVEKKETANGGVSWTTSSITSASPAGSDNIRPFVPRNYAPGKFEVLWMRGDYMHYTAFNTAIMTNNDIGRIQASLDFGTATSGVGTGFARVTGTTAYSSGNYGWTVADCSSADRGAPDTIKGDLVYHSAARTLRIDLCNGNYNVKVVMGDQSFLHDQMSLTANGVLINGSINTAAAAWYTASFVSVVNAGKLELTFADAGGTSPHWVVNSVEVSLQ